MARARLILTAAAVLLFAVAALVAHGSVSGEAATVAYAGLACFAAAHLP